MFKKKSKLFWLYLILSFLFLITNRGSFVQSQEVISLGEEEPDVVIEEEPFVDVSQKSLVVDEVNHIEKRVVSNDDTYLDHVFSFNFMLLSGPYKTHFYLSYEKLYTPFWGIELKVGGAVADTFIEIEKGGRKQDVILYTYMVGLLAKYYVMGKGPSGLWFGAGFDLFFNSIDPKGLDIFETTTHLSARVGYSFVFAKRIFLGADVGIGYVSPGIGTISESLSYSGALLSAQSNFGFLF